MSIVAPITATTIGSDSLFPEDINQYLEQEVKRVPEAAGLAALAMNLGLYDQQARPRPALDQWQTWKRKPLPIKERSNGNQ